MSTFECNACAETDGFIAPCRLVLPEFFADDTHVAFCPINSEECGWQLVPNSDAVELATTPNIARQDMPLCCHAASCLRVRKWFCGGPGSGEATLLGCYRSAAQSAVA